MTLYLEALLEEARALNVTELHAALDQSVTLVRGEQEWEASLPPFTEAHARHLQEELSPDHSMILSACGAASFVWTLNEECAFAFGLLAPQGLITAFEAYPGLPPTPAEREAAILAAQQSGVVGGADAFLMIWMRDRARRQCD